MAAVREKETSRVIVRKSVLPLSLHSLLTEFVSSLRTIARDRSSMGFSVLVVGLCIAGGAPVLSVFESAFLRPLPYERPGATVILLSGDRPLFISPVESRELGRHRDLFSDVAIYVTRWVTLIASDRPERVRAAYVSGTFFDLFHAQPNRGRVPAQTDDRLGGSAVAVASESLWDRLFKNQEFTGAEELPVQGVVHSLVGVVPGTFTFPEESVDLWIPISPVFPDTHDNPRSRVFTFVARLSEGVGISQATGRVNQLLTRSSENTGLRAFPPSELTTLRDHLTGDVGPALAVLLVASGFMLIVACVTLMNLALIREEKLRQASAVRWVLGAQKLRLAVRPLTEILLAGGAGGGAGLFLGYLLLQYLKLVGRREIPGLPEANLNGAVVAVVLLAVIVSMLVVVMVPISRICRHKTFLVDLSRRSSIQSTPHRIPAVILLVLEQVTVLVLLSMTLTYISESSSFHRLDLGFDPKDVGTFEVVLPRSYYSSASEAADFFREAQQQLGALPGAIDVSGATSLPLTSSGSMVKCISMGDPASVLVDRFIVLPGFFRTMKVPVLRGRGIEPSDWHAKEPRVVVDAALADRFWPNANPVGKRLRIIYGPEERWSLVVGVVPSLRRYGLRYAGRAPRRAGQVYQAFSPAWEATSTFRMYFTVRAAPNMLDATATGSRKLIQSLDSSLPISEERTMEAIVLDFFAEARFFNSILAILSLVGLCVGLLGFYGVGAHSVLCRQHEFAIRFALGETPRKLLTQIAKQGLTWMIWVAILGFYLLHGIGNLLETLFVGSVRPDVGALLSALSLLSAVGTAAFCAPAVSMLRAGGRRFVQALSR